MAGTVADVMVATLKASGVRRVYGVPGDSLNGFTDALRRDGGLAWQHMRHEEAAGFAAAGDAALTGALPVCAGSCGPGNLHLINGLFDANRSRVPVLAIAAQIPREEIGSGYFQETHPQDLFRECSVYCELVSIPGQLPRVLEIAMRTALARGGVAVVVIPGEIFLADAPADAKAVPVRAVPPVIRPDEGSLATAAEVLNAAGRSRSPCWRPRRWTTVTAVTRQPAPCSRPRKNSSIGSPAGREIPSRFAAAMLRFATSRRSGGSWRSQDRYHRGRDPVQAAPARLARWPRGGLRGRAVWPAHRRVLVRQSCRGGLGFRWCGGRRTGRQPGAARLPGRPCPDRGTARTAGPRGRAGHGRGQSA